VTADLLQSLDDRSLAGVLARLPVDDFGRVVTALVKGRDGLSLELTAAVVARLAETTAGAREEILRQEEAWRSSLPGRWVLAELWLAEPTRIAASAELWTELIEQAPEHAAAAHFGRARARREIGDVAGSVSDLLAAARRTSDYGLLNKAARLLDRLRAKGATVPGRAIRLAVASSSTTDLLPPLLRLIGARDGLALDVHCTPFGAFRQEILDPRSGLHAFRPEFVVIATHWRDASLGPLGNPATAVEATFAELTQLWEAARQSGPCTVLQHAFDFPAHESAGYLAATESGGRGAILAEINRRLFAARVPGVLIVDCPRLAARAGTERWSDAALWHVAKQHPAPPVLPDLVDRYVRLVAARVGLARKVAVFDLDNTLWGGVVGEDGPHGVRVGPPTAVGEAHAALQRYARELKDRGVLLAVCSKNNDADAREPFRSTLGMVLKEQDFVAFLANWDEKPVNLRRIAQLLNLGSDSLVFIDDNPLERAKVRQAMPEVAVVDLPNDPAGFVAALDRGAYFEALALSAEDLSRHESYAANVQRETLKTETGNLEGFLRKLDMRMHHGPFNDAVHDRVVQLFNKTNQFNVTTRRHGSAEVAAMRADPRVWTQYFRLVDCFGDNGIVGLVVAGPSADAPEVWEIDSLLMSCRVLGRQAEEFMVATLLAEAKRRGARAVRGRFLPTAKNSMVADLYPKLGFVAEAATPGGSATWLWNLSTQAVPEVRWVRSAGP
jgi:FkbH-like protein